MRNVLKWAAIWLLFACAGCGGTPTPADRPSSQDKPTATPQDVLAAFRDASLEVGHSMTMTRDDYGLAPLVAIRAVRFLIPSLGSDSGGRVFTFANATDLRKLERYYVAFGRESAALFSWTFANERRLVLVQVNGDLPEAKADGYRRVVAGL